jgi:hypothetical protein
MGSALFGFTKKEITLQDNMAMSGYLLRTKRSAGVHDPLYVKMMIFRQNDTAGALASFDLVGLDEDTVNLIKNDIYKKTNILVNNIMLHCIHTHSGPVTSNQIDRDQEVARNFISDLVNTASEAALEALKYMEPCKLEVYNGTSKAGVNRVLAQMWGGRDSENWEIRDYDNLGDAGYKTISELLNKGYKPESFIDEQVIIAKIFNENNDVKGILINYACHPVALEFTNLLMSKDYIYFMEEALKTKYKNANIIFLNGCAGDINSKKRGGYEEAKEIGEELGNDALNSIINTKNIKLQGDKIEIKTIPFHFHVDAKINKKIAPERIKTYKTGLENAIKEKNAILEHIYRDYGKWAALMMELDEEDKMPKEKQTNLTVFSILGLNIIGLPFEVFHEIGEEIKKSTGCENTMVAAYTNGEYGYFISELLAPYAKYEGQESFKWSIWPGPISIKCGKELIQTIKSSFNFTKRNYK